jgi:hypothetical protein
MGTVGWQESVRRLRATAGNRRRRASNTPPISNTGALPTGIVTGGLRI